MEDNQKVSEEYKRWFNRGYNLRKTMPKIFNGMTIPKNEPKEITQAFEAGRKEFELEYGIDRKREELKEQYKTHSRNKENNFKIDR